MNVGVVRWGGGGKCGMLEESEGQGSRLRGERQGGRQRKRGSQVRVSEGDRPQRTQDIFLNTCGCPTPNLLRRCSTDPEKIRLKGSSAIATTFCSYFLFASAAFIVFLQPTALHYIRMANYTSSVPAKLLTHLKEISESLKTRKCVTLEF